MLLLGEVLGRQARPGDLLFLSGDLGVGKTTLTKGIARGLGISEPVTSLYTREQTPVTLDDGRVVDAWVYFYNAPLGRADRIESGDYLQHLKVRRPA